MEQIVDKITPDMLGNVEAYTTAIVVDKWIDVIWSIIGIWLVIIVIGIFVYHIIKEDF